MNWKKILFFVGLFLIPISLNACSIQTVGLSKNNFKGYEKEVKAIQVLLAQDFDLYYPGWVTGYFGDLTEIAIKKLQARYGFATTGVMDANTISVLCHQQSKNLCPIRNYGYTVGDEDKVNKNNDIRIVQQLLSTTKKYHTGYYGKITAQMIAAFQSKFNLNVTGVLDKNTRDVMCKMITGVSPSQVSSYDLELVEIRSSKGNELKMNEKTSIILKEKNNSNVEIPVHDLIFKLNDKTATGALDKLGVSQEREQEILSFVCDSPGEKVFEVMLDYSDKIKEIDEVNNIKQLVVNCVGETDYGYECLIDKNYQCAYGKGGRIENIENCQESCVKSTDKNKPDLLISKVERDGDKIKIYEENKGVVADSHYLEIKVSYGDETIDFGKPVELPYMIKGERDFSFDFKCPFDGNFKFDFNIDATNVISESDEENNTFEKEIVCGDVVDPSNIMYSCNKENGKCYISTENTVGDYLTAEDCVKNCTFTGNDVKGGGYCCDVNTGKCTQYDDALARSQKGEPCCADETDCSTKCHEGYLQKQEVEKQQEQPEQPPAKGVYCCNVAQKQCILYTTLESANARDAAGEFCSIDQAECTKACSVIVEKEEEGLSGTRLVTFDLNNNVNLQTNCDNKYIQVNWKGFNNVLKYFKESNLRAYDKLVFAYNNISLGSSNVDIVNFADSGNITLKNPKSGKIHTFLCDSSVTNSSSFLEWSKNTADTRCVSQSSFALNLTCTDENTITGYTLEDNRSGCVDGNINLEIKVKSLIDKDIDARVLVFDTYYDVMEGKNKIQVFFSEYYTLEAGKTGYISESFPFLSGPWGGDNFFVGVVSGVSGSMDNATLAAQLMTNRNYYNVIEVRPSNGCKTMAASNVAGKIKFGAPKNQKVEITGNWNNAKGKISANTNGVNGFLPPVTVDLSNILSGVANISSGGLITPSAINNNPNSSRYSDGNTEAVFLTLQVENGLYKGSVGMNFSAEIRVDFNGSKLYIPIPKQEILEIFLSESKGLVPGEYILPLELKGFRPDSYKATYNFNWYLSYTGQDNLDTSFLEIKTNMAKATEGTDISIAPSYSYDDYLKSYVLKYTYGEKININDLDVRAKECGDKINIKVNALDFKDIHGKTYAYNKEWNFVSDSGYSSSQKFVLNGMCNESFAGNHEISFTNDCLPSKEIKWVVSCEKPVAVPEFSITGSEEQEISCGKEKELDFNIDFKNVEDKDLEKYNVFYFYGYVEKWDRNNLPTSFKNISKNLFANINDLYLNLLKQYGISSQTSSTGGKNLFGLEKDVNINNLKLNKDFEDKTLGVMDNVAGGMYVLRENKGTLKGYTRTAKCFTSMCADSISGNRDNKNNDCWKEGFVAVVVVDQGNKVVSNPLYIALQCNSENQIDKSKISFTDYSIISDRDNNKIKVELDMGGFNNLQIKRYIVYPLYSNYYSSPFSENKVTGEFNITGSFVDEKALSTCSSDEVNPVYIKYEIAGTDRSLYVFDPCNKYAGISTGTISGNISNDKVVLKTEDYFNPICATYLNIGGESFLLKDFSTISVPLSSVKNNKISFDYDNWINKGTTFVENIKTEMNFLKKGDLYKKYGLKLTEIENICSGLSNEIKVNVKGSENKFEYDGFEKISNNIVLIKIKANIKNTGINEIDINGVKKSYTFSSSGEYDLNVYYDIFKQQITEVKENKISFIQNILHTILGIDTALAVVNMPYPYPTIYNPVNRITCYKCDESKGECSSYTKQLGGNDLLSSIYNLLAATRPIGGMDNDDKDDPCYPDYSKKSECEDNCSKKVTAPIPSVSITVITKPPVKETCWLYSSKSKTCYKSIYSWECAIVLNSYKYSTKAECEKANISGGGGSDDTDVSCWLYHSTYKNCYESSGFACLSFKSYESKWKCESANGVGSPVPTVALPSTSRPSTTYYQTSSLPSVSKPGMTFCYVYNDDIDSCLITNNCGTNTYPTFATCIAKGGLGDIKKDDENKCYYKIGGTCVGRTTSGSCYQGEYSTYAECMTSTSLFDDLLKGDTSVEASVSDGYCWHIENGKCIGVKSSKCYTGEYMSKTECEKNLTISHTPYVDYSIDDVNDDSIDADVPTPIVSTELPERNIDLTISIKDMFGSLMSETISVTYSGVVDYSVKKEAETNSSSVQTLLEYYKKLFNLK